ncbi:MAG TPA: CPBP family intramembrane glutamic endopeptidase [Ruminococcus sp.]
MNKAPHGDEISAIDVINEFDFSTQNDSYNEKYVNWRKNKKNPFAFNYSKNPKESIFNDSRGFETTTFADAEKRAVTNIMHIIGISMLIAIVIDTIISKFLVLIFNALGLNINVNIFGSGYYGGSTEIVGMIVLISVLKLLVPAIYIHTRLKLPFRVEFMSNVKSSTEIVNAIAITLMVCTVACLPAAYSNDVQDIYAFFMSDGTDDVSFWGQSDFIFYLIFNILVIPIVSELFFRGAIFAALRQFGDVFATIVTAVTACLLTRDFTEMPAAILISVVASLGMLRSGTIITAFFVRIIYRMYSFAIIILSGSNSFKALVHRNTFMLVTFIVGAVTFILIYLAGRSKEKHHIALYKSHTSTLRRYSAAAKAFPYSVMAIICIFEAAFRFLF